MSTREPTRKTAVIQKELHQQYAEFIAMAAYAERLFTEKTKYDVVDFLTVPESFNKTMREFANKYALSAWELEALEPLFLKQGDAVTWESTRNCFMTMAMMACRYFMTYDPDVRIGVEGHEETLEQIQEGLYEVLMQFNPRISRGGKEKS